MSVGTVPCKYEDPSSSPKSADTKLSVTVYACDSRVAETGTECLELVDLLVLSNLYLQVWERPCLNR